MGLSFDFLLFSLLLCCASARVIELSRPTATESELKAASSPCKLHVRTPRAPAHAGILAEPHKPTLFELQLECSGVANVGHALQSKGISGQIEYGTSVSFTYRELGWSKLLVSACPLSTNASAANWCTLATGEKKFEVPVVVTYVRREIRTLSATERDAYFTAVKTLFKYPEDVGKAKYGNNFRNYLELHAKHAASVWVNKGFCNLGHFGPAFTTFHRAFMREFEMALQAVDPSVAVPYWDYLADGALADPRTSPIFGDDYFGSAVGDPEQGYIVTNGHFAYLPIPKGEEAERLGNLTWGRLGPSHMVNRYGFFRSRDTVITTPYLTRYGPGPGGTMPTRGAWLTCRNETLLGAYISCLDASQVHPGPHIYIGGAVGVPSFAEVRSQLDCAGFASEDECGTNYGIIATLAADFRGSEVLDGCLVCDKKCTSVDQPPEECACHCPHPDEPMCKSENYFARVANKGGFKMPESVQRAWKFAHFGTCAPRFTTGDYSDIAASNMDPIFWAHHTNLDRLVSSWRIGHPERPTHAIGFTFPSADERVFPDVWSATNILDPNSAWPGVVPPGDGVASGVCEGHGLYDEVLLGSFANLFESAPRGRPSTNLDLVRSIDTEVFELGRFEYTYDFYDIEEAALAGLRRQRPSVFVATQ